MLEGTLIRLEDPIERFLVRTVNRILTHPHIWKAETVDDIICKLGLTLGHDPVLCILHS